MWYYDVSNISGTHFGAPTLNIFSCVNSKILIQANQDMQVGGMDLKMHKIHEIRPMIRLDLSDGSLHSIVGPMVSYHWKPLENHCYQWFWWPKTIEKPLLAMVFGPKSIGKPLISMVTFHSFNGNGEYKNILNVAMVIITKPIILCWENQQSKP